MKIKRSHLKAMLLDASVQMIDYAHKNNDREWLENNEVFKLIQCLRKSENKIKTLEILDD